ncbi:regulatory protein RecX [Acinetobacter larvae]|uniref:Regulatory protein RecX n=1 Tax=Acinetobacter larvae TaxID=1789224 RepID=A0A1B2M0G6_9GAMM|nr:regulatory protein RecX [Acinetobacter larvae]AOA58696.1 hypothetical protein BFG52_10240 [Acinetobacter larvae]
MSNAKFNKLIDYQQLKQALQQLEHTEHHATASTQPHSKALPSTQQPCSTPPSSTQLSSTQHSANVSTTQPNQALGTEGLTGSRLRSYAFAVIARKEYSKQQLIEKLLLRAHNRNEVLELVEELAQSHYQSDQRTAEMTLNSQLRQGKGPQRIKQALHKKHLDQQLIADDLQEIDWLEQAYQLKCKKFGLEVATEPKLKAKQIRFLQYRGFHLETIFAAIQRLPES